MGNHLRQISFLLLLGLLLAGCATVPKQARNTGPWDLANFRQPPAATWGEPKGLVREVYYEGEPFKGKPTRVFAYYARPEGDGPFPAMLLVHGGGGKAFPDWAEYWAKRGYVALAMDTAGAGPNGRLPDGGPDQTDPTKFRNFQDDEVRDMWTYHAVAAVLRGHALLAAQKEVDPSRVGVTGISWGGYLTCIVAGVDPNLKAAVPVYGCGFLHENSVWLPTFQKMAPDQFARWVRNFDPSQYLPGVSCPILFLNGSNDFAYPMDSYLKCYELVDSPKTLSLRLRLPHGHIWTFKEVDTFIDSHLDRGERMAKIGEMKADAKGVKAGYSSPIPVVKAELNYTMDEGAWQKREWKSLPAELRGGLAVAEFPPAPKGTNQIRLTYFLSLTDIRGVTVSAPHQETILPGGR